MKKRKVLFDLNVILDSVQQRQEHTLPAVNALSQAMTGKVKGYLAGHSIPTLDYLLSKDLNMVHEKRMALIGEMLTFLTVAPVTGSVIKLALESKFKDFEDAVTHYSAKEEEVAVIVTRNVKDFTKGEIPAVLPVTFNAEVEAGDS